MDTTQDLVAFTKHYPPVYTFVMFLTYAVMYYFSYKLHDQLSLTCCPKSVFYRIYTYSLLHGSNIHIIINSSLFLIYSYLIERENGFLRTFLMNTLSIIGGGFVFIFVNSNNQINVVGASGGIYGLLASNIGVLIFDWKQLDRLYRYLHLSLLISPVVSDIVVTGLTYNQSSTIGQPSYSTHIGGFFTGVLASIIFTKTHQLVEPRWQKNLQIGSALIIKIFMLFGVIYTASKTTA